MKLFIKVVIVLLAILSAILLHDQTQDRRYLNDLSKMQKWSAAFNQCVVDMTLAISIKNVSCVIFVDNTRRNAEINTVTSFESVHKFSECQRQGVQQLCFEEGSR